MTDDYISPEQVKEGFKKCHIVVNRLLKDAELSVYFEDEILYVFLCRINPFHF